MSNTTQSDIEAQSGSKVRVTNVPSELSQASQGAEKTEYVATLVGIETIGGGLMEETEKIAVETEDGETRHISLSAWQSELEAGSTRVGVVEDESDTDDDTDADDDAEDAQAADTDVESEDADSEVDSTEESDDADDTPVAAEDEGVELITDGGTNVTLTEYLPAAQHADPSINGAAKVSCIKVGTTWQADGGEAVADLDEYRVECEEFDATFGNWGAAAAHAEEDH